MSLKQLFCKHDYYPWANIYGDVATELGCRTVAICRKCGKRKYLRELYPAPLNYNAVVEFWSLLAVMNEEEAFELTCENMIQDYKLFVKYIGGIKNIEV